MVDEESPMVTNVRYPSNNMVIKACDLLYIGSSVKRGYPGKHRCWNFGIDGTQRVEFFRVVHCYDGADIMVLVPCLHHG